MWFRYKYVTVMFLLFMVFTNGGVLSRSITVDLGSPSTWEIAVEPNPMTIQGVEDSRDPTDRAKQWFTMETPHFHLHYPRGWESLARQVGRIAEDVHRTITPAVDYVPDQKTHVVLLNTSDLTNGMASVLYYNRVAIYLTPPDGGTELDTGAESWVRMLIAHEYTHILQMDLAEGKVRMIRQAFGKVPFVTTPNMLLPLWVLEGYAVNNETKYSGGGRLNGSTYEAYLRAISTEDEFYSLAEIGGGFDLSDTWPGNAGTYIYGASFCEYIMDQYGEKAIVDISRAYSEMPVKGLGHAVRDVLGVSLTRIWDKWKQAIRVKYGQQVDDIREQGLTKTERLTRHGFNVYAPAVSPDGQRVAYAASGQLFPALRVLDPDSGKNWQIVPGYVSVRGRMSWAPDGKRIVYSKLDIYRGENQYNDLYIYDFVNQVEERLTTGMRACDPAWAPDGQRIAFIRLQDGHTDLMVMKSDGTCARTLITGEEGLDISGPAWSPDGRHLAVSIASAGCEDIYILDADGSNLRPLTRDRARAVHPCWHPDGKWLLFSSDQSGVFNLYAYDTDSGDLYQVTNVLYGAWYPNILVNDGKILFQGYSVEGYDLYATTWDRAKWKRLAVDTGHELSDVTAPSIAISVPAQETDAKGGPGQSVDNQDTVFSWSLDDIDPENGAGGGHTADDYRNWPVHPYNSWRSLAPKYVLPSLHQDENGIRFGAMTSGLDVLHRRAFQAEAYVGLGRYPTEYRLDYAHILDIVRDPVLNLSLKHQSVVEDGDDYQEESVSAEVTVPISTQVFSNSDIRLGARLTRKSEVSVEPGVGQGSLLLYSGWDYATVDGSNYMSLLQGLTGMTGVSLKPDEKAVVMGSATTRAYLTLGKNRWVLAARLFGGASTGENTFSLGGVESTGQNSYALRGYESREGQHVAGGTLELRKDVWKIHYGSLDKIAGVIFADAGATWNSHGPDHILSSCGGEIVFHTVYYNIFKSVFRIGCAITPPDHTGYHTRWYIAGGYSF